MPRSHLSYTATVILQALAAGSPYGLDVMDATGLPGGTVYPALRRLELGGFVESEWEQAEIARHERRPARKYYELTAEGREALADAIARYRQLGEPQARAGRKSRRSPPAGA